MDAITIKNFAFGPTSLTVAPGATVTVTNKDSVAHTITSSKAGFDTGDIGPGQSKTFTAPKTPGSYPYICSIHQYMTGTIVVR
jgi:plastocyanin